MHRCGGTGGQGDGNPGVMGREVYRRLEKRGWQPGEIENTFHNVVQFFTIENAYRGGNQEYKVHEAGNSNPPPPFPFWVFMWPNSTRSHGQEPTEYACVTD